MLLILVAIGTPVRARSPVSGETVVLARTQYAPVAAGAVAVTWAPAARAASLEISWRGLVSGC